MALADSPDPPAAATFRDLPWRWSDLAIGLAPAILASAIASAIGPAVAGSAPRWGWIPLTFLALAWMFAVPLRIARRRAGLLPRPPGARRVLIEGAIALLALPIVLVIASAVRFLAARSLAGAGGGSSSPFEAIAGSPEGYHAVALFLLGVTAAPLGEEVVFRGVFYNLLRRRMPWLLAALIQGIGFGLYHPFGLVERATIAAIGFLLALAYEWRRTLLAPILLHSLINAFSLAMLSYTLALAANAPVLGVRGEAHEGGCLVDGVIPGGSAEAAGIRPGDVIVAAGEDPVANLQDIIMILRSRKVGDRIPIRYVRDGEARQVEAVLRARPAAGKP